MSSSLLPEDDEILRQIEQRQAANAARMRGAVTLATEINPDEFADQRRLSQRLGVPPAVVQADPVGAKTSSTLLDVSRAAESSPALKTRFSDADFAKLAQDDSGVLSQLGAAARYLFSAPDAQSTLVGDISAGYHRAGANTWNILRAGAELPAPLLDWMEPMTAVGGNPLRRLAEGATRLQASENAAANAASPARPGIVAGGVSSGVQSFVGNALMLPLALMGPGGAEAALLGMAAQTGGQAYGQAREKGLNPYQALPFATSQAIIEYGTEKIPLFNLVGNLKAGAPLWKTLTQNMKGEIAGEQVATILQDMNEWAVLHPEQTFKDYLAERPSAAAQTLIATVIGVGGNVAVSSSIQAMADNALGRQRDVITAEAGAQNLQQLLALAAQSKLRERAPDTFAEVVQSMADESGGAPPVLRFDARTLVGEDGNGGLLNQEDILRLPSVAAQVAEAIATGGEITVPIGELTALAAGTPLEQKILENARIGEGELSQAEAKEASAQAEQYLQQMADRVIAESQDAMATQASADAVHQQVQTQLDAAARFTPDVNDAYARLVSTFYTAMAGRLGVTPDALYARYPLRVQGLGTQGEVLNAEGDTATSPEFKAWFGDSKVADANGNPSMSYHFTNADFSEFSHEEQDKARSRYGYEGEGPSGYTTTFGRDYVFPRDGFFFFVGEAPAQVPSKFTIGMPVYLSLKNPLDLRGNISPEDTDRIVSWLQSQVNSDPKTGQAGYTLRGDVIGGLRRARKEGMTPQQLWALVKANTFTSRGTLWNRMLDAIGKDGLIFEGNSSGTINLEERRGPGDGKTYTIAVATKPEQIKSAIGNNGNFDPTKASILEQGPRGTFHPDTLTISLLETANLSTFLHETGHFFLEVMADMAAQPGAPAGVAEDMDVLLKWFGVKDSSTWNAMSLDQQRKHHERFAESFEQYLLEGKAPSVELQPLFQRFRAWLTSVYKSLTDFMHGRGLELNDEVRAVFDRMLASEKQIAEAEILRGYAPLFESAKQAGMTPEAWAAYQAQGSAATNAAIDKLQARSVKDMRWASNARSAALKALQKDAEGKRKGIEAEVAAEVAQQPIYQAMRWLRKGEMTSPEGDAVKAEKGFRLNTEALAEMYPETALDNPDLERLKGMTAANGLHPDLVATMFGFASGDALVRQLVDAQPQASVVEGVTDQRMLERHGDLATDRGLARAADEAVHNEARGRFIVTELRALQEGTGERTKTGTTRAGRTISVNTMVRAAKQFAEQLVARRTMRELKVGQHTRAEARAAQLAVDLMKKGDTKGAIIAKRDQALQHYAARETMRAQGEMTKAVEYLKRFDKESVRSKLPLEYQDQIDKLLERVDLRQVSATQAAKRAKLSDWIESQQELGIEVELPDYLLEDAQLKPLQDMKVEEIRGLVDTVRQIEHLGKLKSKLLTAKDEREFRAVADEMVQTLLDNAGDRAAITRTATTLGGKALQAVKMFGAAHIKAATYARVFDGNKDGGPFWNALIRSANVAGDQETTMRAQATEQLDAILDPWLKAGHPSQRRAFATIGRSLTRQEVLVIALNVGNEGNLQRLLGGEGWTVDQITPVLDSLTPADWKTVQAIWDHFDQRKPLIDELEKRVYGKPLKKVEPGSPVADQYKVRGGYYPIVYDPAASQRAEEQSDAEQAKAMLRGAYSAAQVRRGFTKARAEEVVGRPLLYDFSGVYRGVNDQIHYLAWTEWLIDANRLMRDKAIDGAVRSKYGPEAVRQLKSWREDVALGDSAPRHAMDMALGRLRQSVSIAGLGFNVMSAMMQPLGLAQSIVRVGAPWVGQGMMKYIGAPAAMTKEVQNKSSFMANRARTRFRELNELRNRVEGQGAFKRTIGRYAYWLMMQFQQMVDVPTWLGAYEKAISEGNTEDKARALADQGVIDAQGGGQTKDLSAIERGGQAQKLFTVFYSFMNTALNLGVASKMGPDSRGKFAANAVLLYVVPALLGSLLKDALTPGDSGDEDWKKRLRKLLGEQASYLFGLIVVGREFGEVGKTLTGADHPRDYAGPAGVRAIADSYQFTKQAMQGEFDDSFRKAFVNLMGDVAGIPSAQTNRTITGAKALKEGKTQNPLALLFGYQEPH